MDDKVRLEREIAFYTALLKQHKDKTRSSHLDSHGRSSSASGLPAMAKSATGHSTEQSTTISGSKRRLVITTDSAAHQSNRLVVKPSGPAEKSRRSVVTLSRSSQIQTGSSKSAPVAVTSFSNIRSNTQYSYRPPPVTSERSPVKAQILHPKTTLQTVNNKGAQSHHTSGFTKSLQSSATQGLVSNRFVWVNKQASTSTAMQKEPSANKRKVTTASLPEVPAVPAKQAKTLPPSTSKKPVTGFSADKFLVNSKYKLIKADQPASKNTKPIASTTAAPAKRPTSGKKVVTRYKIRTTTNRSATGSTPAPGYRLSKSGKRWISKYKIQPRIDTPSVKKTMKPTYRYPSTGIYGSSPVLHKRPSGKFGISSPYKLDMRKQLSPWAVKTRYKLDKQLLKMPNRRSSKPKVPQLHWGKQTPSPMRKSVYKWRRSSSSSTKLPRAGFVSPYKLVRKSTTSTPTSADAKVPRAGKTTVVRQLASRALMRSAAVSLRSKYKKDNRTEKHCLYYMRYGKCKRGDGCMYIHDPERIAVCTRYLRGTCNIKDCPFSHEARKEKVPVCQHFLRGCCLRDNCPYLHVNVGRNAPICQSFAETRYCSLGEKCTKLHTDICPDRDEDGKCSRGSKCRLRHPKKIKAAPRLSPSSRFRPTTDEVVADETPSSPKSKMTIIKDEIVAITAASDGLRVPDGIKLSEPLPAFISLDAHSSMFDDSPNANPGKARVNTTPIKLKNKPSFLE